MKNEKTFHKQDRKNKREAGTTSRFSVHPLFLLLGVYSALEGSLPVFLMSTLVALLHECAHAVEAAKLGYKLDKIILMPYGAMISGDMRGISPRDEIRVALAGPLFNLCTAFAFAALWWIVPAAYPFTDSACYVSLSVAAVNLIPAHPLDGGRVLSACLKTKLSDRKADLITAAVSLFSASAVLVFAASSFFFNPARPNLSLAVFAVFLFVGAISARQKGRSGIYTRIDFSAVDLKNGAEIRRVAVDGNCTVKRALRFLSDGKFLVLEVYVRGIKCGEIRQDDLYRLFLDRGLYAKISDAVTPSPVPPPDRSEKSPKNDKKSRKTL